MYEGILTWAFKTGVKIKRKNEKLLEMLIFDVRGEETPGRFLEKLSSRLSEYKTNRNIALNLSIEPKIVGEKWHGDKFYHMKAAVLTGFINALSKRGEENE